MLNSTSGLCGFYNQEQSDDFLLPDGSTANTVDKFAKGWLTVCELFMSINIEELNS